VPTVAQVEEQIVACEGFRVRLTPLGPKVKTLPSYDFLVMAPQRWKVSDWKSVRLAAYVTLLRDATVLRPDGLPLRRDLQLGNLRDTYYEEKYGSLAPLPGPLTGDAPVALADEVSRRRPARPRPDR
jgi:hypothetical protein